MLHSGDTDLDDLAAPLRETVRADISRLRSACRGDQIPFVRRPEGIRYLTFAGKMVNTAISLATEQVEWKAYDVAACVTTPIDWSAVPQRPEAYERVFDQLFSAPGGQSLYQTLLPPGLRLQELLQSWLRDDAVVRVLARLGTSTPVEIDERLASRFVAFAEDPHLR